MKIRRDYVTNSSSTSYIVAFKGLSEIDDETTKRYPFLVQYQEIAREMIFGNGGDYYYSGTTEIIDNAADLFNVMAEKYGYGYTDDEFKELLTEDEYLRGIYEDAKKKLSEGYKILFKDIDYGDIRNELFERIQSDDFIILDGEG